VPRLPPCRRRIEALVALLSGSRESRWPALALYATFVPASASVRELVTASSLEVASDAPAALEYAVLSLSALATAGGGAATGVALPPSPPPPHAASNAACSAAIAGRTP